MNIIMRFHTNSRYQSREEKAEYVWQKYRTILEKSRILDVGGDECHLKKHLPDKATYTAIGLGGSPDRVIDLEKENIPFDDRSFDCVLCLDVLEHLENIHHVFDELCRVTKHHLVLSLPNPWACLYAALIRPTPDGNPMKFYGLPLEKPGDRHKWFFSSEEAERFITYRAGRNNMHVVQMDQEEMTSEGRGAGALLRNMARSFLFRQDLNTRNLYKGTVWAVLRPDDISEKS